MTTNKPNSKPDKIKAPFTNDQVELLINHQAGIMFHLYTCGGCNSRLPLIVSIYGFECYYCGYIQDWAHSPE